MTAQEPRRDAGFVVLDALLATILLVTAGTVILAIAVTTIRQRGAELDRSVALVMSQSLMRQYLLVGPAGVSSLEASDELYAYKIEPVLKADQPEVQTVSVVATSRVLTGASERLTFLAPASVAVVQ